MRRWHSSKSSNKGAETALVRRWHSSKSSNKEAVTALVRRWHSSKSSNKGAVTALVRRWHSSNSSNGRQCVGKSLPIYCYHVQVYKKNCYEAMMKDFSWLALHSGVQNKITATIKSFNIATQEKTSCSNKLLTGEHIAATLRFSQQ